MLEDYGRIFKLTGRLDTVTDIVKRSGVQFELRLHCLRPITQVTSATSSKASATIRITIASMLCPTSVGVPVISPGSNSRHNADFVSDRHRRTPQVCGYRVSASGRPAMRVWGLRAEELSPVQEPRCSYLV